MNKFSLVPSRLLAPLPLALIMLTTAATTLAGALAFEHIGSLAPCPLCLQQRIPYWSALPLGALFLVAFRWRYPAVGAGLMSLLALSFALGALLAFYHAGVEWHWWRGPASCSGAAPPDTVEALLEGLRAGPLPRCDEAPWRLAGISLSGYNVLISVFLATLGFIIAGQCWREHRGQQEQS